MSDKILKIQILDIISVWHSAFYSSIPIVKKRALRILNTIGPCNKLQIEEDSIPKSFFVVRDKDQIVATFKIINNEVKDIEYL